MFTGITPATLKKSIGLHRLRVAATGAYAKASATACGARPASLPPTGIPAAVSVFAPDSYREWTATYFCFASLHELIPLKRESVPPGR